MKKLIPFLLSLIIILSCVLVAGCDDKETVTEIAAGNPVRLLDSVTPDYDNMFFDDFTGGVDKESWYIGKQAWGVNANGGVIPENVGYTDDGVLVLSGKGSYYTAGEVAGVGAVKDGSLTGACLISKFTTGPGSYSIKMKVLPRLGACTAFWTYCYEPETGGNHEIDIELPGGAAHSEVISFENVLNTNYITVDQNNSNDVNLTQTFGSDTVIALNDGEWHTFGFDWYTDPQMVVYHVDGIITAVSSIFVPYVESRLWLGVWFPNSPGFVDYAEFESDVMCVDYVRYVPFLEQEYQSYNPQVASNQVAADDEYPTQPIALSKVNKIANGTFEYVLSHDADGYGWNKVKRNLSEEERTAIKAEIKKQVAQDTSLSDTEIERITEERYNERVSEILNAPEDEYCLIDESIGYRQSCGLSVKDIGRYRQIIDAMSEGFILDFSCMAKGQGSVVIQFQTEGGRGISEQTIQINCDDFTEFKLNLTAPEGTRQVAVIVSSQYGSTLYADNFVLYIN